MNILILGCIVQARIGSTRLPGKVLMKLDKKQTVLDYVINQLNHSKLISKIIIATTSKNEDLQIIEKAKKLKIDYFRGNSTDLLNRYYFCSKKFSLDNILRITSDCPLIDPEKIDQMIKFFHQNNYDYVSNYFPKTFPIGMGMEIFSKKALKLAWKNALLPSEREHISPFFYNHKNKLKFFNIENEVNYSNIRITIDRINDLKLIKHLVKNISVRPIKLNDIIDYYKTNQSVFQINRSYDENEGLQKSLEIDKKFLSKNNN